MILGTHRHTINELLQAIQEESAKYNMALNLDKCVNLTVNRIQSSIKFLDGSAVSRKHQAKYLAATLSDSVDNHREVLKRIRQAAATAS